MRTQNQSGFSLIELMIVIGIIGILATFAAPRMKSFSGRAKQVEAKNILNHISTLQEAYAIENSGYVTVSDGTFYGYTPSTGASNCTPGGVLGTAISNLGLKIEPCNAKSPRYAYTIATDATGYLATATTGTGTNNRVFVGCATANTLTMNANREFDETNFKSACPD